MQASQLMSMLLSVLGWAVVASAQNSQADWHVKGAVFHQGSGQPFRLLSDDSSATFEQVQHNYTAGVIAANKQHTVEERTAGGWQNCTLFGVELVTAGCNDHNGPAGFFKTLGAEKTRSALQQLLIDAFGTDSANGRSPSSCAISRETNDLLCVSSIAKHNIEMTSSRRQRIVDYAMSCQKDGALLSSEYFLLGAGQDSVCISNSPRGCDMDYEECISVMIAHGFGDNIAPTILYGEGEEKIRDHA